MSGAEISRSLIDQSWYMRTYPEVEESGLPPCEYFVRTGIYQGHVPHPLFDPHWYLRTYPEAADSGLRPFEHFAKIGIHEGKNPHPMFDTEFYTMLYEQLPGKAPFLDFIEKGLAIGRTPTPFFDCAWYRDQYPDIIECEPPFLHFVCKGMFEGRTPLRLFDPSWYMKTYPDVAASTHAAFMHFLYFGNREGRDPHPLFDTSWYVRQYADRLGSLTPFEHYLRNGVLQPNQGFDTSFVASQLAGLLQNGAKRSKSLIGVREVGTRAVLGQVVCPGKTLLDRYVANWRHHGLRPCAIFDPVYYLQAHSDVAVADVDPLWHFLKFGLRELRRPCRELDLGFYMRQAKTPDPEAAFWSVFKSGVAPHIRPTPCFLPSWDTGVLDRMCRALDNGRPSILMVSHNGGGGTAKHVDELMTALNGSANSLLLVSNGSTMSLQLQRGPAPLVFDAQDLTGVLADALVALKVTRIHVHHAQGYNERLLPFLLAAKLPYDVTLHDLYFLAPNPMFVHSRAARVRPGLDEAMAMAMSAPLDGPLPENMTLLDWRNGFVPVLRGAERLISPSHFVAETYNSFDSNLVPIVAPHLEIWRPELPIKRPVLRSTDIFFVATLGAVAEHKGALLLMQCAIQARLRDLPIRFVVIGTCPDFLTRAGVTMTGPYDDESLPRLLNRHRIAALWFPYLAPESYGYALTVGLWSGLPIVATDVGCLPERLTHSSQATMFSVEAPPELWVEHFEHLRRQHVSGPIRSTSVPPPPNTFYTAGYLEPIQGSSGSG